MISYSQSNLINIREDINSSIYSANDRALLSNLMIQYITKEVIEDHCIMTPTSGGGIHSDFDFLDFHRAYIEKMEDWLFLTGHTKFVPLPYWDPISTSPQIFQVIDLIDCQLSVCPFTATCDPVLNWSPIISRPTYLSTIIQPGGFNDFCDFNMDPSSLPAATNCCKNGISRAIEGSGPDIIGDGDGWNYDYHNSVHNALGGVMERMKSPSTPLFWLWHAYVDLIYKDWEINCPQSSTPYIDLYMKDHPYDVPSERDLGREPNIYNGPQYLSNDIWCRVTNDGFTNDTHQNPIVDGVSPTYVYVRVRNRGASVSSGLNDNLKLYWSKAATALTWPNHWNGSMTSPALMGDLIGSQAISAIQVGDQQILEFVWYPPDPSTYTSFNNEPAHFCLLARIESLDDPMTNEVTTGTWNLGDNVKNNNNIVWKNLTVIDNNMMGVNGEYVNNGNIYVGNVIDESVSYDLKLTTYAEYGTINIFQDAEVLISMEESVWNKWIAGGGLGQNIDVVDEDNHIVQILSDNASLEKLNFNALERGMINVKFNFLTEKYPYEEKYTFHIEQTMNEATQVLGGEGYSIIPPDRTIFLANAGVDVIISKYDTILLSVDDIGEDALYQWFDESGDEVSENREFNSSPENTTIYRLKVTSEDGGLVDYDEIRVTVKPYEILTMSPNPATNQVTLTYKINGASNPTISLVKPYSNSNNIYNLIPNSTSIIIDITDLSPGVYSVILICDGVSHDTQTLIIN